MPSVIGKAKGKGRGKNTQSVVVRPGSTHVEEEWEHVTEPGAETHNTFQFQPKYDREPGMNQALNLSDFQHLLIVLGPCLLMM